MWTFPPAILSVSSSLSPASGSERQVPGGIYVNEIAGIDAQTVSAYVNSED